MRVKAEKSRPGTELSRVPGSAATQQSRPPLGQALPTQSTASWVCSLQLHTLCELLRKTSDTGEAHQGWAAPLPGPPQGLLCGVLHSALRGDHCPFGESGDAGTSYCACHRLHGCVVNGLRPSDPWPSSCTLPSGPVWPRVIRAVPLSQSWGDPAHMSGWPSALTAQLSLTAGDVSEGEAAWCSENL